MDGAKVKLYVYDLSQGLARQFSPMLLGKQIDGVWHTGVVVNNVEYFYGAGIQRARAGCTPFGQPYQVIDLGTTYVTQDVLDEYLADMAPRFSVQTYSLFDNNCNNFSDELATFLTGTGIPAHITALPREVLATPFGQMLRPMLSQMENQLSHVSAAQSPSPSPQQPAGRVPTTSQLPAQLSGTTGTTRVTPTAATSAGTASTATQPATATAEPLAAVDAATLAAAAQRVAAAFNDHRLPQDAAEQVASVLQHRTQASTHASESQHGDDITRTATSPRANGAAAPRQSAAVPSTTVTAASATAASSMDADAAAKAAFEELVRCEFAVLMRSGALTANEAAAEAVRRASSRASQPNLAGRA